MTRAHILLLLLTPLGVSSHSSTRPACDEPEVADAVQVQPGTAGLLAVPVPAPDPAAASGGVTPAELVVFGASSADPGNVFLITGGLLPAPPYWQGRFCNGPNWVDQLAGLLGVPVPQPFLLGGTNYAVGGAGAGPGFSNACLGSNCAPNIGLQIEYYLASNPTIDGDELFVLQGGGNDLGAFTGLDNATIAAYQMREHIETLAEIGAENFVVINLGPDNTSPTKWSTSNNAYILRFNEMLEAHLQLLESQLGLTIARVDLYSLKSEMIADPGAFGLVNVTDPACPACGPSSTIVPNPDEYYYWDAVHATTVVHGFVADMAADSISVALGL